MTEQDKSEIRKIIREEIEAKLTGRPFLTVLKDKEMSRQEYKVPKIINIETVSPSY